MLMLKKLFFILMFCLIFLFNHNQLLAGKLKVTIGAKENVNDSNFKKAYFAGGCFWCMEESFEKKEGVIEVISGYSGGNTKNPTYEEVTYGNTGHFEVIEIIYDKNKINFEDLLDHFWINIDPFDEYGQFCDRGYSYRSVAFYMNEKQKALIENSIMKLEKKFQMKLFGIK